MSSPKVDIPQTNYTKQLNQTLAGLKGTAGGFFALNQQYAAPYTDLNLQTLARTLFGSDKAPGELPLLSAAQTYTRGQDISDILAYGPAGYAALMRANPGLAMSLFNANNQGLETFAPGGLMRQLQNTAQDQLDLGGQLSPEELDIGTQGARAGLADRGIVGTMPGLATELLTRDALSNARMGQRMQFATGVEQLAGQDRNYLNQLAQLNAGIYDPSQQVLGRGSSSLSGLLGGGGVNPLALMGTLNTQNLFNPGQGQDAFNTNVNAQGAAAISNANAQAGTNNALIGGGAALAGAAIIAI